jgi:hypothetical protein
MSHWGVTPEGLSLTAAGVTLFARLTREQMLRLAADLLQRAVHRADGTEPVE